MEAIVIYHIFKECWIQNENGTYLIYLMFMRTALQIKPVPQILRKTKQN